MTELIQDTEQSSLIETIDHLLAEATPVAAGQLSELAGSTADKGARKAARRALYLLNQRGIAPPDEGLASRSVASSARATETMRAWSSAFDGAGNRLLILMLAGADGGMATVAQLLGNDEMGLRNLTLERRRQREVLPLMERLEGRIDEGLVMAEIEADYARWLIARFRELNFRRSTTTPAGFVDLQSRIGHASKGYEEPPVYAHFASDEIEPGADLQRDPADLFKLPWFEPWFFAVEDVVPWLQRWIDADKSVVVFAEKAGPVRRRGIAKEAAKALFSGDVRARYIVRLEESADILLLRGRPHEARLALFHALALKADVPIDEVPFAEELAARTLEAGAEMAAGAQRDSDGGAAEQATAPTAG